MLQYLNFKNLNNIEIIEPTKNTIILFHDKEMLFKFEREMVYFITELVTNGKCKYIDYALTDVKTETVDVQLELTKESLAIYNINNGEQKIIATTEISNIQLLQDVKDLWFIDKNNNIWDCYALTDFEGDVAERYKGDNIKLIKAIAQGKFGCYEKYGL